MHASVKVHFFPPGHQVLRFYRNERIFLLQCVRHTLTNALDPASQHYRHSTQFVDCHLRAVLFDTCWEQFESSMSVAAQDSHRVRGGEGRRGEERGGEGVEPLLTTCVCVCVDTRDGAGVFAVGPPGAGGLQSPVLPCCSHPPVASLLG